MILADDEGKQHLAHRYKSSNTGAIFLLYQYKMYKYRRNWRNCLAVLVLADDEGKLADDEMSRASCSGHDEGELHWKYTCEYMFLVYI